MGGVMSRILRASLVLALLAGLTVVGAHPASADAGSCGSTSASNGCDLYQPNSQYRHQTSDGDLNNNYYAGGQSVNDHVDWVKKGTTNYVRFCAWQHNNQGGSLRGYSASTSSWTVLSNDDVSSVYLRTSASC